MIFSLAFALTSFSSETDGKEKHAQPKRIVVPKIQTSIDIDGELKEAAWNKAAVIPRFYINDGSGPNTESTEVRLFYSKTALHIAWICMDSDIQATFTKRDSQLWDEEVAEFFITSGRLDRYFELQWSPLGTIFDAIIRNRLGDDGFSKGIKGEWDWTSKKMKAAVIAKGTVGKSGDKDVKWQVEVMLPFSDLDQPTPAPGDVWRANFYRYNRTGKELELLAWSPVLRPNFHEPNRFGYLEFAK